MMILDILYPALKQLEPVSKTPHQRRQSDEQLRVCKAVEPRISHNIRMRRKEAKIRTKKRGKENRLTSSQYTAYSPWKNSTTPPPTPSPSLPPHPATSRARTRDSAGKRPRRDARGTRSSPPPSPPESPTASPHRPPRPTPIAAPSLLCPCTPAAPPPGSAPAASPRRTPAATPRARTPTGTAGSRGRSRGAAGRGRPRGWRRRARRGGWRGRAGWRAGR